jgi:hypothetical protein
MRFPAAVALFFATGLGGCASTPSAEQRIRTDPNVLTLEEIRSIEAANLYEVVQRLRPRWLAPRARPGFGSESGGAEPEIAVYEGINRLGDLRTLRDLHPGFAERLRFLDGPTATASLPGAGPRNPLAGAIVIERRSTEP